MTWGAKRRLWSVHWAQLVLVLLLLVTGRALAQVPQEATFSGRLVDGGGTPLTSPVTFELWIYDAATGGTALYAEQHGPVTLDANGNFSVLLGTGTDFGGPFPPFDPDLFSGVSRHVEVVLVAPVSETLTPRVPIASVPWAYVAQQANEVVRDATAPRFEDCGDGTVADHQTGLQWEKKTGTVGSPVTCDPAGCPDPHDVNNRYKWSSAGTDPDGGAFTDFLAKLNTQTFGDATAGEIYSNPPVTGCLAGHCDWRLPIVDEIGTILVGPDAAPGQATACPVAPCIDADFAAIGGPTASFWHWSASTAASNPSIAWVAFFDVGLLQDTLGKTSQLHVRAVRMGSCDR